MPLAYLKGGFIVCLNWLTTCNQNPTGLETALQASNAYWLAIIGYYSGTLFAMLPILFVFGFTVAHMDVMSTGIPAQAKTISQFIQLFQSLKTFKIYPI